LLEEPGAAEHGSSLVFESNFDTELEEASEARVLHLQLLCQSISGALGSVFRYCDGFAESMTGSELSSELSARQASASAAYQGHSHRDLRRIRLEQHLREVLNGFLLALSKSGAARAVSRSA